MVQSLPQAGTYLPIEDHGIIGDLHTVALVGKKMARLTGAVFPLLMHPASLEPCWMLTYANHLGLYSEEIGPVE